MNRLVIIGGGIAGLSAAYSAAKAEKFDQVTLIEADPRWGGKITTERVAFAGSHFIIEGGPDTFLASKPWGVALCRQLGLEQRLHGTNPSQKNTYVLKKGRLQPLPEGLAMMIPSDVPSILRSRLISWVGKCRMGLDFLLPPKKTGGDESLGSFVSRRLGREAFENLIEPLMSGIYAGDGDQLSLASTFPYLRDLENTYGSLARGALVLRKKNSASAVQGSRSAFLTPTTGLAEVVEALVDFLQTKIRLRPGKKVVQVSRGAGLNSAFRIELESGEIFEADSMILATPAYVSGNLLAAIDPELGGTLLRIPYTSTATVSLAYHLADIPRKLDGYGYVIPRREGRKALACTWTSTKFPHRAPDGYGLIRVFVGRAGQDIPWDESELLALAREELSLTLGIGAEPLVSRVFMWDAAMPQYNLGHPELLESIDRALENYPNLALAGNGYRGIGIPDCIHSGELAVNKILSGVGVEKSPPPASRAN